MWIIHVQSPTNLPKCMWKLVFNVVEVIFWFGNLKEKPIKPKGIMSHLKFSKKNAFGKSFLKNKIKLQLIWIYENMVKF